ncbi:MAG: HDIG domain-containing protein [Endomicrobia bacterium]|nr:HDIG domain-containing protein [Endomicrobiia bacterium]MCL2507532.1 HDIG domain-containing protein [Endomicrobiia bacterium]
MNFYKKIKMALGKFLISAAEKLVADKDDAPVVRNAKNIFLREIKVPVFLSVGITIIAVYFMFVMGLGFSYGNMFAVAIFTALIIVFFDIHTRGKEKSILSDSDAVVLMCLIFIIGILFLQISVYHEYLSPFVFPVSAFALMTAMLLSPRIGLLYTLMLSLYAGLLSNMRFDVFLVLLCSGVIAMADANAIRNRAGFVITGLKTIIASASILTMFFLLKQYTFAQYLGNLKFSVFNGVASVIILLVLIPVFEKLFSRTTNIKLIELADFNNVLLKRLMLEAPGTYHHSLWTASIAEQAANAIGANAILARVCSYYHDIGKLKNPEYFIENQTCAINPHDSLTPAMSGLILLSHVKDGVAFAKKYNLDSEIISNIEQHHGTTVMSYFYRKALEKNNDLDVSNFRYPGPKPQTKVAAIIMIADSSEAACRALDDPTAVRIKETVEKIINNKFTDGQFSDCPITLKDLENIRNSVTSTLIGIYHARVEYKEIDNNKVQITNSKEQSTK